MTGNRSSSPEDDNFKRPSMSNGYLGINSNWLKMITVKVDNSAHVLTHLSATTDADLISAPLTWLKIIAEFRESNKPTNTHDMRNDGTYGR